jgi:sodium/hydrogen antiporter
LKSTRRIERRHTSALPTAARTCGSSSPGDRQIDPTAFWYLLAGLLLISMGMMESLLERLPLSPAMFYLPVGYLLGPSGFGMITIEPVHHARLLTAATEAALIVSLFTVGLKLRLPISDRIWWLPVRLGLIAMVITIGLLTAIGVFLLGFPLGAAVLMAAILAPTDPILASDVQVKDLGERDRIRFGLTGEGGLNDGTTLPFVMLGLGLLGIEEAREYAQAGAIAKAGWEIAVGAASGWLLGWAIGKLVLLLRHRYRMALGMEEFLTLGMIAVSYGLAHLIGGNSFIAVFMTGLAVRRIEFASSGEEHPGDVIGPVAAGEEHDIATDPHKAPAYMTETVLGFNQQLEHIAEFIMVVLLGILLSTTGLAAEGVWLAALLFLIVRPLSVMLALPGSDTSLMQRALMSWFGIRGIGSLYYLAFALQYRWLPDLAPRLASTVLTVVAASVLIHGISSTPLMDFYYRRRGKTDSF